MKVRKTFDFSDEDRLALANHFGVEGKASYERCEGWLEMVVHSTLESIQHDWRMAQIPVEED